MPRYSLSRKVGGGDVDQNIVRGNISGDEVNAVSGPFLARRAPVSLGQRVGLGGAIPRRKLDGYWVLDAQSGEERCPARRGGIVTGQRAEIVECIEAARLS